MNTTPIIGAPDMISIPHDRHRPSTQRSATESETGLAGNTGKPGFAA